MTLGKAILEALDVARNAPPLTAKGIYGLVKIDLSPEPTLSEVIAELGVLESRRQVVAIHDEDRGGTVYQITASGRARALS